MSNKLVAIELNVHPWMWIKEQCSQDRYPGCEYAHELIDITTTMECGTDLKKYQCRNCGKIIYRHY